MMHVSPKMPRGLHWVNLNNHFLGKKKYVIDFLNRFTYIHPIISQGSGTSTNKVELDRLVLQCKTTIPGNYVCGACKATEINLIFLYGDLLVLLHLKILLLLFRCIHEKCWVVSNIKVVSLIESIVKEELDVSRGS